MKNELVKGPGIIKVNTVILADPQISKVVDQEIQQMMSQALEDWNPHEKLEFLKVTIGTVISSKVAKIRNELKDEISQSESSLNQIEQIIIRANKNGNNTDHEQNLKIEACDLAISTIKEQLNQLRTKLDEKLSFVSRAKWFEYGERSNKFFLNLNKC